MAEPLRWQSLQASADEEPCARHLTEDLEVPQPLVSHHLRVPRDAGFLESERSLCWTYRLSPTAIAALGDEFAAVAANAAAPASERGS